MTVFVFLQALQAQQKALEDLRTMVKQREEKLQEKERELIKREQEVNEKLARMVSNKLSLIINNAYCDVKIWNQF